MICCTFLFLSQRAGITNASLSNSRVDRLDLESETEKAYGEAIETCTCLALEISKDLHHYALEKKVSKSTLMSSQKAIDMINKGLSYVKTSYDNLSGYLIAFDSQLERSMYELIVQRA